MEAIGDCRSLSRLGRGVCNLCIHIIGHLRHRSSKAYTSPVMTLSRAKARSVQRYLGGSAIKSRWP